MTAADQIHALADTGTPGKWFAAHTYIDGQDERVLTDRRMASRDAAKIVAAVNALPHIADLIDAFDNVPLDSDPSPEPWEQWWRNLFAARDALLEALGVTP